MYSHTRKHNETYRRLRDQETMRLRRAAAAVGDYAPDDAEACERALLEADRVVLARQRALAIAAWARRRSMSRPPARARRSAARRRRSSASSGGGSSGGDGDGDGDTDSDGGDAASAYPYFDPSSDPNLLPLHPLALASGIPSLGGAV